MMQVLSILIVFVLLGGSIALVLATLVRSSDAILDAMAGQRPGAKLLSVPRRAIRRSTLATYRSQPLRVAA